MKQFIKRIAAIALVVCAALTAPTVQAAATSTPHIPDSFLYDVMRAQINFSTDTIKCGLAAAGYVYNRATHTKRSDVTEASGTGYTAGGQTVVPTLTNNTTLHKTVIVFPQIVWTGSVTVTAGHSFCYKARGGAATADELIMVGQFSANEASTGGTYTVQSITLEFTGF